jgi:hypothetical protein
MLLIGRPVKWVEDRYENLISTGFARDYHMTGQMALDESGRMIGLRVTLLSDKGAFFADAQPTRFRAGLFHYDSGDYPRAMRLALEMLGYDELRREQAERRARGELMGIGVASFTEVVGAGKGAEYDIAGLRMFDSAELRVHPTGKAVLKLGVQTQGQGHMTTFAQIVAEELGIPAADVEVQEGDTDNTPYGLGTYASRSTPVGGAATAMATQSEDDVEALRGALQTPAAYIGLVASRRRAESVLAAPRDRGMDEAALARVQAPAGLDLGRTAIRRSPSPSSSSWSASGRPPTTPSGSGPRLLGRRPSTPSAAWPSTWPRRATTSPTPVASTGSAPPAAGRSSRRTRSATRPRRAERGLPAPTASPSAGPASNRRGGSGPFPSAAATGRRPARGEPGAHAGGRPLLQVPNWPK